MAHQILCDLSKVVGDVLCDVMVGEPTCRDWFAASMHSMRWLTVLDVADKPQHVDGVGCFVLPYIRVVINMFRFHDAIEPRFYLAGKTRNIFIALTITMD